MKKSQKALSFILAVILLMTMFSTTIFAAIDPFGDPIIEGSAAIDIFLNTDPSSSVLGSEFSIVLYKKIKALLTDEGLSNVNVRISSPVINISTTDLTGWYVYDHYDTGYYANQPAWAAEGAVGYNANLTLRPYFPHTQTANATTIPKVTVSEWVKAPYYKNTSYPTVTSLGTFDQHIYSRIDENGIPIIDFVGYYNSHFNDFMLYPCTSQEEKQVTFDVDASKVNAHSLYGAGFLINAGIDGSGYIHGYVLYYVYPNESSTPGSLVLYKIKDNIKASDTTLTSTNNKSFHDYYKNDTSAAGSQTTNIFTQVASVTLTKNINWWEQMSMKLSISPDSITVYQRPNIDDDEILATKIMEVGTKTNVNYTVTGYNGFGPCVGYKGHACTRATQYTYSNIKMAYVDQVENIFTVLKQANYLQNADLYFVDLTETARTIDSEAETDSIEQAAAYMQTRLIRYITNCTNDLLSDSTNGDTAPLGDNGITIDLVNTNLAQYIDDLATEIANYIISTYKTGETPQYNNQLPLSQPVANLSLVKDVDEAQSGNSTAFIDIIKRDLIGDGKPQGVYGFDELSKASSIVIQDGSGNPTTIYARIEEYQYAIEFPGTISETVKAYLESIGYTVGGNTATITHNDPNEKLFEVTKDWPVGNYNVSLVVGDDTEINNKSEPVSVNFTIVEDVQSPTLSGIGSDGITIKDGKISFKATDAGYGVFGYEITYGEATGKNVKYLDNPVASVDYSNILLPTDGSGDITLTVYDAAGNASSITIPTIPYINFTDESLNGFTGTITITVDDGNPVTLNPGEKIPESLMGKGKVIVKKTVTVVSKGVTSTVDVTVDIEIPSRPDVPKYKFSDDFIDFENETILKDKIPDGFQFSADGGKTWDIVDEDFKLEPGVIYTFSLAATETSFKSDPTDLPTLTVPSRPDGPISGVDLSDIDYTDEEITVPVGIEYSTDGGENWILSDGNDIISVVPGEEIWFRTPATNNNFESEITILEVPERPAVPDDEDFPKINYNDKSIEIPSGFEYYDEENKKWVSNDSNEAMVVPVTPGDNIRYRKSATEDDFASEEVEVSIPRKPAASTVKLPAIDYINETVHVSSDLEYWNGNTWVAGEDSYITVILIPGVDIKFCTRATSTSFESEVATLIVPERPDAPTTPKFNYNDSNFYINVIIGVDSTMEYKLSTDTDYISVGSNTSLSLLLGSYDIRYKASQDLEKFASKYITVNVVHGSIVDEDNKPVTGGEISLKQGNTDVSDQTSIGGSGTGEFTFENVQDGTYNLVITVPASESIGDDTTITVIVEIKDGNIISVDGEPGSEIKIPKGRKNTKIVVEGTNDTPDVVVGGLQDVLNDVLDKFPGGAKDNIEDGTDKLEIEFIVKGFDKDDPRTYPYPVENTTYSYLPTGDEVDSIDDCAADAAKTVGLYFDLSLFMHYWQLENTEYTSYFSDIENADSTRLIELASLVTVYIPMPESIRGKEGYAIYRYHDDGVDEITTIANSDGEYFTLIDTNDDGIDDMIVLHVRKFSTYAIAYLLAECGVTGVTIPDGDIRNEVDGNYVYIYVDYDVTSQNIKVDVSNGATWKLYSDADCKNEITNKTMGNLAVGDNYAYIEVTAADGTTTSVYKVIVNRGPSYKCDIIDVLMPDHADFNGKNIRKTVHNDVIIQLIDVEVSPDATWKLYSDPEGKYEIADKTMHNLNVGNNVAYIIVTAQDGVTTKVYTVIITREASLLPIYINEILNGNGANTGGVGSNPVIEYPASSNSGRVIVRPSSPKLGETVTVNVIPNDGYFVESVTIIGPDGQPVAFTDHGNGEYTFTAEYPGEYTVTPTFANAGNPKDNGITDKLKTEDHIAYMMGYEDISFRPNGNLTRAEAAMMLYRLLLDQDIEKSTSFSDVPDDKWYAEAVYALSAIQIINGYSDGTFQPDAYITRAEFVALVSRFVNEAAAEAGDNISFTDVSETHWAFDAISIAAGCNWVGGYDDGTFRPQNNITRVEAAKIMNAVLGRIADKDYIDSHIELLKSFSDVLRDFWGYYEIMETTNYHEFERYEYHENWEIVKDDNP